MQIDVYFDTICPWCWVGKANLEQALESFNEDVVISYKTFFLYEGIPEEGIPAKDHLKKKYGMNDQQEKEYLQNLKKMGLEAGVEFTFKSRDFIPNTISSHILIKTSPESRRAEVLEEVFFQGFNQGVNLGDIEELKAICENLGLSVEQFESAILDPNSKNEVMRDYYQAISLGVRGVPFYVINDKYAIYGAQKPDLILQTLRQVKARDEQIKLM